MRTDKPSIRVINALARLTRDKWICGQDIHNLCTRLSKLAAPCGWGNVYSASMRGECAVVGMLRGEPPAYSYDENYGEIFKALHNVKTRKDASVELLILKFKLRSKNYAQ